MNSHLTAQAYARGYAEGLRTAAKRDAAAVLLSSLDRLTQELEAARACLDMERLLREEAERRAAETAGRNAGLHLEIALLKRRAA